MSQPALGQSQPRQIEKTSSTEPIVGLRVWKIIMDGGLPKLKSVVQDVVWPYRKPIQKDSLHDVGIHAVKTGLRSFPSISDPGGIFGVGGDVIHLFNSYEADVAGEIYMWGIVHEHTYGYLAEYAYPKKLFLHNDFDPLKAMMLEEEYGVPCEYRSEFKSKAERIKEKRKMEEEQLKQMVARQAAMIAVQMEQAKLMQNTVPKFLSSEVQNAVGGRTASGIQAAKEEAEKSTTRKFLEGFMKGFAGK